MFFLLRPFEDEQSCHRPRGFSLVESIVYIALLVAVVGLFTQLTRQMIVVLHTTRATENAVANARNAMEIIGQEVRHADVIYTPTSRFDVATGQLSLLTTRDLPTGESSTYVDFYLDAGAVYLKRESVSAVRLTGTSVTITKLQFSHLDQASAIPAVRLILTATAGGGGASPIRPLTLTSTFALRTYD